MNMFSGMKGRALQGTLARSETKYDEEFFFSTRLKARPRSTEEELFDEITRYDLHPGNYR